MSLHWPDRDNIRLQFDDYVTNYFSPIGLHATPLFVDIPNSAYHARTKIAGHFDMGLVAQDLADLLSDKQILPDASHRFFVANGDLFVDGTLTSVKLENGPQIIGYCLDALMMYSLKEGTFLWTNDERLGSQLEEIAVQIAGFGHDKPARTARF